MKKKLLLALMALLPLAVFAATLDVSKFTATNINYGSTALPPVVADGYTETTHYTVVTDKFYTSDTGAGETAVGTGGANLKVAKKGKYYIKVLGAGLYDGQTIYVDFWIKGIDVTIDFNAVAKTFGEKDSDHPIAYVLKDNEDNAFANTGNVLGLTVKRATGEDVKAGGYAYSFEWTNENFALTRKSGDTDVYTINPKDISATATITAWQGNVVYTGKDIKGVYTVKDGPTSTAKTLDADKDYTVAVAHNVGPYAPTITFKGNYSGSITVAAEKKFEVTKAPIVVGVEDLEAIYDGSTDYKNQTTAAAGKFTYSGFVGDDVANAADIKSNFVAPTSVVATAAKAINAGDYELTITGGNTGDYDGANKNYEFVTYMPGKLTVKQAELVIKSKNASKTIGEKDPTFEIVPVAGLTITGVQFTREAGETAGDFIITPNVDAIVVKKSGTDVTANYKPTVAAAAEQGKLTIGKTKIYVVIKDAQKLYGQKEPEFAYTVTGLKGTDKLGAFTITREAGEKPGGYSMTATVANPDESKYSEVIVANGIFTIKKAQLEFTMPAQNVVKDNTKAALKKDNIKVTGINNSDKAVDLYDLDFNGVTLDGDKITAENNTYGEGYKATLKTSTVKVDGANVAINTLYEIVLNKELGTVGTTISGKLIVNDGTAAAIAFTTATDAADYNKIKAHAGETQNVTVTLNNRNARVIPAGTAHPWKKEIWNTMVLPFEVTVAELSTQLGYAIVNLVDPSKTTEGNVQFKLEMQKIPANTPFCVKTSSDIANGKVLTFNDKLIVDGGENPSVDAGMGYKFVGAYKNKTINKTTPTYNFLRGDNDKWAHIGATSANSWTVVPFDAYVELTEAAAARGVTFTFEEIDGTATVIKAVDAEVTEIAESAKSAAEGWYTINGIKLNAKPTQKGIYIFNGKKVAIQ